MKRIIFFLSISALFMSILSCDDIDKEEFKTADYTVSGKVEKGPFISGSTINLQPMDSKLAPTGSTFSTTITDNSGNFSFGTTTLVTPYAQLTANGYFFNEITGALSSGTLSLRALVNLKEQQTVNVNILTHLKYARILDLVEKDKKSYNEANKQAQKELLSAFGLEQFSESDAASYSITSGTPEAGALIAISSLILKNRTEAQVTEYLAQLSKEFGETGTFSVATKAIITKDRNALTKDLQKIGKNITTRYEELGQSIKVVPLEYYYDWDDDGVAGNEFSDPADPPRLSTSEINVPANGGNYTLNIESSVKLYLECHNLLGEVPLNTISLENFWTEMYDIECGPGIIDTTLTGNQLIIKVSETRSRKQKISEIPLYDFAGNEVAKVTLIQEGNTNLPNPGLGADAASVAMGAFAAMTDVMKYMSVEVNDYGLNSEGQLRAPLTTDNAIVRSLWGGYYNTINRINTVDYFDKQKEAAFGAPCSLFRAIAYYNMVTLWGAVPYVDKASVEYEYGTYIDRMPEDVLLDSLQTILESILPELQERKNDYRNNFNDIFFSSKDVARILLADIHMYRHEYDKAKPYLSDVVSTGHYSLTDDNDIIMAYVQDDFIYQGLVIPLFTYSDVLLSLAECENSLGNDTEAWTKAKDVAESKGTFAETSAPTDLLQYISKVRKISMSNVVGRFAFMKRTGLAKPEQSYYDFILLFPIPKDEINRSPNWTQNPGY